MFKKSIFTTFFTFVFLWLGTVGNVNSQQPPVNQQAAVNQQELDNFIQNFTHSLTPENIITFHHMYFSDDTRPRELQGGGEPIIEPGQQVYNGNAYNIQFDLISGAAQGGDISHKYFDEYVPIDYNIYLPKGSTPNAVMVNVYGGYGVKEPDLAKTNFSYRSSLVQQCLKNNIAYVELKLINVRDLKVHQSSMPEDLFNKVQKSIKYFHDLIKTKPESIHPSLSVLKGAKTFLYGASFGGLMAVRHAQLYNKSSFDGYIAHQGPLDYLRVQAEFSLGHNPPPYLNPMNYIDQIESPLLILHNADDNNVPLRALEDFFDRIEGKISNGQIQVFITPRGNRSSINNVVNKGHFFPEDVSYRNDYFGVLTDFILKGGSKLPSLSKWRIDKYMNSVKDRNHNVSTQSLRRCGFDYFLDRTPVMDRFLTYSRRLYIQSLKKDKDTSKHKEPTAAYIDGRLYRSVAKARKKGQSNNKNRSSKPPLEEYEPTKIWRKYYLPIYLGVKWVASAYADARWVMCTNSKDLNGHAGGYPYTTGSQYLKDLKSAVSIISTLNNKLNNPINREKELSDKAIKNMLKEFLPKYIHYYIERYSDGQLPGNLNIDDIINSLAGNEGVQKEIKNLINTPSTIIEGTLQAFDADRLYNSVRVSLMLIEALLKANTDIFDADFYQHNGIFNLQTPEMQEEMRRARWTIEHNLYKKNQASFRVLTDGVLQGYKNKKEKFLKYFYESDEDALKPNSDSRRNQKVKLELGGEDYYTLGKLAFEKKVNTLVIGDFLNRWHLKHLVAAFKDTKPEDKKYLKEIIFEQGQLWAMDSEVERLKTLLRELKEVAPDVEKFEFKSIVEDDSVDVRQTLRDIFGEKAYFPEQGLS